ncbi:hypothetical protein [Acidocella sp.]|uniref:hypothetical protein n=1 Tax=Acidocella sp. TaxID=50710 RepID=UPI00344C2D3D
MGGIGFKWREPFAQKRRKIIQISPVRRQRIACRAALRSLHFQKRLGLAIYRHTPNVIFGSGDANQQ